MKDVTQISKRSSTKLESLCDVERALSESKDSASAVSGTVHLVLMLKFVFNSCDHRLLFSGFVFSEMYFTLK